MSIMNTRRMITIVSAGMISVMNTGTKMNAAVNITTTAIMIMGRRAAGNIIAMNGMRTVVAADMIMAWVIASAAAVVTITAAEETGRCWSCA